jgi:kexin-like serine endoprotease (fragment)
MKKNVMRGLICAVAVACSTAPAVTLLPVVGAAPAQPNVAGHPSNRFQPGPLPIPNEKALVDKAGELNRTFPNIVTKLPDQPAQLVKKRDAEAALQRAVADYERQIAALQENMRTNTALTGENGQANQNYEKQRQVYEAAVTARNEAIKKLREVEEFNRDIDSRNAEAKRLYDDAMRSYNESKQKYDTAKAEYDRWERANAGIRKKNDELRARYEREYQEYENKLADYRVKKAAYDEFVKRQIGAGADPLHAIQPTELAAGQPFKLTHRPGTGRKSDIYHVRINGRDPEYQRNCERVQDPLAAKNSTHAFACSVKRGDKIEVIWRGRAIDKATGRRMDLKITLDNIALFDRGRELGLSPQVPGAARGNNATIWIPSNSLDNFTFDNIASADQKHEYTYSDNGQPYDKMFYITMGSLDYSLMDGSFGEEYTAEFAAPKSGVKATFLNRDTYIDTSAQRVEGGGETATSRAFFISNRYRREYYPNDLEGHTNDREQSITKIGVTFLVENGAKVATGNTIHTGFRGGLNFRETREPQDRRFTYNWIHNEILSTAETIARTRVEPIPPVAPTPPRYQPLPETPVVPPEPVHPPVPTVLEKKPLPEVPEPPTPPTQPNAKPLVPANYRLAHINVMERGNLKILKEVTEPNRVYYPGDTITYKITVGNTGQDDINDIEVRDIVSDGLDANTVAIKAPQKVHTTADRNKVRIERLAGGETVSFTVSATVKNNTKNKNVVNTARATTPDDPGKGVGEECVDNTTLAADTDGCDIVETPVSEPPAPHIEVQKLINGHDANTMQEAFGLHSALGGTMDITYVVRNTGNTDIKGIHVTDNIPQINEQLKTAMFTKGNKTFANGKLDLAAGEEATTTLRQVDSPRQGVFHNNIATAEGKPNHPGYKTPPPPVAANDPAWAFRYPKVNLPQTGATELAGLGAVLAGLFGGALWMSRRKPKALGGDTTNSDE